MRLAPMVVIALVASALLAGPTLAHHKPGHQTPPGQGPGTGVHDNRGTIKVHEGDGEPSALMSNAAQVCEFHIHMFKFHAGQTLTISIVGQGGNPGSSTYADTVTTDANGDARSPATGAITGFADGSYKVSVDTGRGGPGKQDKHKVFQVDCTDEQAPPPPPGGGDQGNNQPGPGNGNNQPGPGSGNNQPTPGGDEEAGPPQGPAPGNGPEAGPGNSPEGPPKPGDLPDTATDDTANASVPLFAGLCLFLAAAGGLVVVNRRRLPTS
jgi:hypothetical protein